MKRIDYKLFTILFMILGLIFVSCSKDVDIKTQNEYEEKETYDEGSAIVKMFLPDYYGLAAEKDSRAIAPQTKYVSLSAYNNVSCQWNMLETISVDSAEITPVENSPEGFPGSVYTFVFSKVYTKTYAKDALKVDLLDSSKNLIASGTNATAVTVEYGKTATTTFYTLPCVLYNDYSEFNLLNGEMKFLRYNFAANEHCTLHIDVSGQKYPDVVVFNSDGTFADYIVVDNFEESRIEFLENENTIKYIGVWADDEEQISKCNVKLYRDLQDFDFRDSSIGFWAGENYQINLTPIPSDAYLGEPVYTTDNENLKVSENGIITSDKTCEGTVTVTKRPVFLQLLLSPVNFFRKFFKKEPLKVTLLRFIGKTICLPSSDTMKKSSEPQETFYWLSALNRKYVLQNRYYKYFNSFSHKNLQKKRWEIW